MTPLGDKLAEARKERGWSLRRVETDTGIRNAHLSQIETGTIERPEPNILWTLASAYGLDYAELLRLAGHVGGGEKASRTPMSAVAWRAEDLTPEEQEKVLRFMDGLRRGQKEGDTGPT